PTRRESHLAARRHEDTRRATRAAIDPAYAGVRAARAAAPPDWLVHTPACPRPNCAPQRAGSASVPPPRLAPGVRSRGARAGEPRASAPGSGAHSPWLALERGHAHVKARAAPA